MHLIRRLHRVHKITAERLPQCLSIRNYASNNESTATSEQTIEIPDRISRSSTDILYALASTVGCDPTAPHYKYHDDPYLIPTSNMSKRAFALSQESGRKAAKWIKEENRELFLHKEADPHIEAFTPKMVFTEESEVDETSLKRLIMQSQLSDAILVYNLMQQKNIEVSPELKQSLLEMISFYNHIEPLPEDLIEERMFIQGNSSRDRNAKTWKDGDLAEQIFSEIEPKTPAAYAAIIRGMAKYKQGERAYALFQEAIEKRFELDTNTFNALINITRLLKETPDERWAFCRDLLQQMVQQQLQPNLGTMNAMLETVSSFGNYKLARSCALKVLAEFKRFGIEPSLGSYTYILQIFCRERAPVSHVLVDILNEIKDKDFTIQDSKDTSFFSTAMEICRYQLIDKSLAKKLHQMLLTGKNYDLIGDTQKENIYYRHYFVLLCQTEPIEEFMKIYDQLVPNIYIPEPGVMEEILKAVENHIAIELVPRLWSDIIVFNLSSREGLITRVLSIMINNKPNTDLFMQKELPKQFAEIALDIYKQQEDARKNKNIVFTGQMLGDILSLLVRGGYFDKAVNVFNNIEKHQHRIPGTPSESSLEEFINACIENKSPSQAITCLQYAVDNHMESLNLARKINAGFTLNEVHLSKMKSMVGDSF